MTGSQHLATKYCATAVLRQELSSWAFHQTKFASLFQIETALSASNSSKSDSNPLSSEAEELAEEALNVLAKMEGDVDNEAEAAELAKILTRPWLEGLLAAHDKISAFKTTPISPNSAEEALIERLSHYSEPNIKIVKIEKSTEPLGATVKNEGELWFIKHESKRANIRRHEVKILKLFLETFH